MPARRRAGCQSRLECSYRLKYFPHDAVRGDSPPLTRLALPNMEGASLEIQIIPRESGQFAQAHSGVEGYSQEGSEILERALWSRASPRISRGGNT